MTMTTGDAARILAVAAAFDRRTVGELDAQAWADALDDLDPRECAEAVRQHYREDDRWVMPSHVRSLVETRHKALARERTEARTFAEIEAAKPAQTDAERIDEARREARAAFDRAIAEKHAGDEPDDATEPLHLSPVSRPAQPLNGGNE